MTDDALSLKLAALADPTRRAILRRLAGGEATVTELARPFDMGMPAVTKHLKVLERAGLISRGKHAQQRPCRLAPGALQEVDAWLEQYRRYIDDSLDQLQDYLRDLQPPNPRRSQMPQATQTASREIITERLIDYPRALVFKAWTHVDHLPKWISPRGYEITVQEADIREGGSWTYTMVAPDGTVYPNYMRFDELKPVEKLAYSHGTAADDIWFTVDVSFTEEDGKTRVRSRHLFPTEEGCAAARAMGAVELGAQSWDKMEERLATMGLTLTRTFDAPKALVYKAFTEGDRLAKWWGPKGFGMDVKRADIRPGGDFHYRMFNDQAEMWGRIQFLELEPTDRVTYINTFSDPEGGVTRAPFMPAFPARIYNVVTLTEKDGKTTLKMRGGPIDASPEELAAYEGLTASMQEGFGNSFDQLAALLAEG